ncbi:MAG: MtrB/PioB family decaheme-associated outer membrane protein [Methylophilales bacterium]|nr:MtrB/PioB family decaheme-associated outer membrane protein [Methylophilales bacterium]
MKTNSTKNNILALAVQSALLVMFALPMIATADAAVDDEATALTHPTNSVEVGVSNVSRDSAKFGEYNGLDKSGAYGIANINLRGGSAYDDSDSVMRWQLKATDLGTTSREVGASVSKQGQWSIGVNFDELRHNITDSYQTPYQGSTGGNNFTLPTGFSTTSNTNSLNSVTQKPFLHTLDINTTRENSSISVGYTINPQWDIKLDINHLNQTGAKLMGFASAAKGPVGTTVPTGETIAILPNPTNYKTDTINLALNWAGDKAHINTSYFGSYFRNDYDRVTFQTFAGNNITQTMSAAPDNDFHQFNLTGGYSFSPKTKLVGGLSYGRNTQNDNFAYDSFMMITQPSKSSLDGVIVSTHADLKLTDQSVKNLALSAGFKYDERDNQTSSNIYDFYAVDGAHPGHYPSSTPLSNRKTQFELSGDYRLTPSQHVRFAYNRENVSRWCNQYAVGIVGAYVAGVNNYPAGTNCVVATDSADDKISASYKISATEDLKLNAGYSYSNRKTDSDPNAIGPFISTNGNVDPTLNSALPSQLRGINAGDFRGFYPFFDASRKQQMLKAGMDWQANEKLSVGLSGRFTDDNYDSQYGVTAGNTWSLNADATYSINENGSISTYITKEHRQRDLTNKQNAAAVSNVPVAPSTSNKLSVPANSSWTNKLSDEDITFGLGVKQGGLMGGKIQVAGDLTYSLGETGYGTVLNYNGVDLLNQTCSSAAYLSCGQLPDIKNRITQLKLSGDYKVNKNGRVAVGYIYKHLTSNDYYFNALQYGFTPNGLMPTNQQSGSYSVNVVSATYIYTF